MTELSGESRVEAVPGVKGEAWAASAVYGLAHGPYSAGVLGVNDDPSDQSGPGLKGQSRATGVWGESETWMGAYGHTTSSTGGAGVMGEASASGGNGVYGLAHAPYAAGVAGVNDDQGPTAGPGILGKSRANGVWGESETWMGVYGKTSSVTGGAGVLGEAAPGVGAGVMGKGGYYAGYFEGNVSVTRDLNVGGDLILSGADFAEGLPAASVDVTPGSCVVIDTDGAVAVCDADYDRRVAGIVSGAGGLKPAVVLDRQNGVPVALMGTAFVWVDADRASVAVGDLLTTSSTPGHAMKVIEDRLAFGAVIGKALSSLPRGRGLVKVFVSAG